MNVAEAIPPDHNRIGFVDMPHERGVQRMEGFDQELVEFETARNQSGPRERPGQTTVFQTRFPSEPTVHAPRFASLDADPDKKISGDVVTLTHTCEKGDLQAEDADQIARYIRSEVDAGRRQFSDFLILTRKKKDRIGPDRALDQCRKALDLNPHFGPAHWCMGYA